MIESQERVRHAIIEWRKPGSIDRSPRMFEAIKIEARALLATGELDRPGRRPETIAQLRRDLVASWPIIRAGRVPRDEIEVTGFYNIVGDQAATLAILIAERRKST